MLLSLFADHGNKSEDAFEVHVIRLMSCIIICQHLVAHVVGAREHKRQLWNIVRVLEGMIHAPTSTILLARVLFNIAADLLGILEIQLLPNQVWVMNNARVDAPRNCQESDH